MFKSSKADVCLFLEGTFPYISGGVSSWTYDLIRAQKDLTFYLVCILPPKGTLISHYDIPSNVVGMDHVFLQKLPQEAKYAQIDERKKFFQEIEVPLLTLQQRGTLESFKKINDLFNTYRPYLDEYFLLNSEEAWNMLQRMYLSTMGDTSFLHYFWSWRSLLGAFYTVLLADLPSAGVYHTFCTGYAGLFLVRAHLETGRPCLITEHGIYTNERRIEITAADWLADRKAMSLNIEKNRFERDLKDYWIDSFVSYSKLCYECCDEIITIYEGNKQLQKADGADPSKMRVIPNGVEIEEFSHIPKELSDVPRIALIGRVVPIKDVKSFIRAVALLKQRLPQLKAWVIGPTDEDSAYYQECLDLVQSYQLQDALIFTGKVDIKDYIGKIDALVLSSISEAQPLVLLEAGTAGIPCVATEVGACPEMILGRKNEKPRLGPGGCIAQLANPESIADAVSKLLADPVFYQACSQAMKERVQKYYSKADWCRAYRELYEKALNQV